MFIYHRLGKIPKHFKNSWIISAVLSAVQYMFTVCAWWLRACWYVLETINCSPFTLWNVGFRGMMPLVWLILIFSRIYIHSLAFIKFVHPSPIAEIPLPLLIAGQLSGKKLPVWINRATWWDFLPGMHLCTEDLSIPLIAVAQRRPPPPPLRIPDRDSNRGPTLQQECVITFELRHNPILFFTKETGF